MELFAVSLQIHFVPVYRFTIRVFFARLLLVLRYNQTITTPHTISKS